MNFFGNSDVLAHMVLWPLSHIRRNWKLSWAPDMAQYRSEANSFAEELNQVVDEIESCPVSQPYHDNEDVLAEYVRTKLKWPIKKEGKRWVGADYAFILEQGGYSDINERELIQACAGRVQACKNRNQDHFDDVEESHQRMIACVLSIIIYHRTKYDEPNTVITRR